MTIEVRHPLPADVPEIFRWKIHIIENGIRKGILSECVEA